MNKLIYLILFLPLIGVSQTKDITELKGPYLGQKPPGNTPEVFAPGIISKENRWEFSPAFSSGGNEFYCTIWEKQDRSDERIWYSKTCGENWTNLSLALFSSDHFEYLPFFTTGNGLYFLSKMPIPGNKEPCEYSNLWFVSLNDSIKNDPQIVDLGDSIFPRYFSISENKTVYLNLEGKSGIYKSIYKNNVYQKPVKLEGDIHLLNGVSHPFVSPDESYILVDAPGTSGIEGDYDIFISFKNEDNFWSYPVHLDNNINSYYFEGAASITKDRKYIFFTRFVNGVSDIYWVSSKVIEILKN